MNRFAKQSRVAGVSARGDLLALWEAAVSAALPDGKFEGLLPDRPKGRTLVLGAGKASARMAAAFEAAWGECEGLVITRYRHAFPTRFVEVAEAGHPVPDDAGVSATRRVMELARSAGPDDLVVFLMSGGASSLLVSPIRGLSLEEKQSLNQGLLRSGMPIEAMNEIRRCVSAVKGGKLAKVAAPAKIVTYLISDVPGDRPGVVGSGPTVSSVTNPRRALELLRQYEVTASPSILAAITGGESTATSSDVPAAVHVLATPLMALQAAADEARRQGIQAVVLGDALEGEAREVGKVLGGIARSIAVHGLPIRPPCVLLSGGETTVTIRGEGRGGRNTEFLLSLLGSVTGLENRISAIACDTDGIDGMEDNAGGLFDEATTFKATQLRLKSDDFLSRNDAYGFFAAIGDLVVTGPTHTNVNDFRAIVIR